MQKRHVPTRPSFALDFPRHPELDAAVEAFANGNYARVRSDGARILASAADDHVKGAARILIERTAPAPLALVLLGLTAFLLAVVGGWWTLHARAPAPPTTHARPARMPDEPPSLKPR